MSNWNEVNCRMDCGRCNHIGKPSATKGSKLCLQLRREIPEDRDTSFSFMLLLKSLFKRKGIMRATGTTGLEEKKKDLE